MHCLKQAVARAASSRPQGRWAAAIGQGRPPRPTIPSTPLHQAKRGRASPPASEVASASRPRLAAPSRPRWPPWALGASPPMSPRRTALARQRPVQGPASPSAPQFSASPPSESLSHCHPPDLPPPSPFREPDHHHTLPTSDFSSLPSRFLSPPSFHRRKKYHNETRHAPRTTLAAGTRLIETKRNQGDPAVGVCLSLDPGRQPIARVPFALFLPHPASDLRLKPDNVLTSRPLGRPLLFAPPPPSSTTAARPAPLTAPRSPPPRAPILSPRDKFQASARKQRRAPSAPLFAVPQLATQALGLSDGCSEGTSSTPRRLTGSGRVATPATARETWKGFSSAVRPSPTPPRLELVFDDFSSQHSLIPLGSLPGSSRTNRQLVRAAIFKHRRATRPGWPPCHEPSVAAT